MSDAAVTAPAAELRAGTKLEGRVALVTGGSRGIGAAICRSLASQGGIVAAGFSSNRELAQQLLEELERGGAGASIHHGNVGDPDDCLRVVREVIDRNGRLDILVNNAGITLDRRRLGLSKSQRPARRRARRRRRAPARTHPDFQTALADYLTTLSSRWRCRLVPAVVPEPLRVRG